MADTPLRKPRWYLIPVRILIVTFLVTLLSFALSLLLGIFGYLASPLWLMFLLTFNWTLWYRSHTGLSEITVWAWLARRKRQALRLKSSSRNG